MKSTSRLVKLYMDYRRKGVPARYAVRGARAALAAEKLQIEWHDFYGKRFGVWRDGYFLMLATVTVDDDYNFTEDSCGTFTDTWQKGAIDLHPRDNRFCRFFVPLVSEDEHFSSLHKSGMSKSVAHKLAQEYVKRDLDRAREGVYYYGIDVKVYLSDQETEDLFTYANSAPAISGRVMEEISMTCCEAEDSDVAEVAEEALFPARKALDVLLSGVEGGGWTITGSTPC